jgi:hypothetical protein
VPRERDNQTDELQRFAAESPENRRLLAEETFVVGVSETIIAAMLQQNVSKTEMARRLGVRVPCISKFLRGEQNLCLRTVARMADAMGMRAQLVLRRVDR